MSQLRTVIDLDAIAHNTRAMKQHIGAGVQLMAVVKADGYNHGAVEVAQVMSANGADCFGVATVSEALALKDAGIEEPVLAWIWRPGDDITDALAAGVELGVPSLHHLRALIDAAVPARICLALETGLHRSGLDESAWFEAFSTVRDAAHLTVTGLFTHLACADDPHASVTDQQLAEFRRAVALGRELGLELPVNHAANSPAAITRRDSHFDQVRVGLALYGMNPVPETDTLGLRPAMTWEADVIVVKPISPGQSVSYGHTFTADRHGYTAVIPVGYADGLPRSAQDVLEVTIGGTRYAQIGRVCMDQVVVDLGDNPHAVAPGDTAVLFGPGGMSVEELAAGLNTINYEVACLPKGRTQREYVNEGQEHAH